MAVPIAWLVPPVLASVPSSGLLGFGVPAVLAATLGGWLIGPRAARVNSGSGALGAILRMVVAIDLLEAAAIAVLLAVLVASEALLIDGSIGDPATATTLLSTLVAAPAVALVGILSVGPFVLVPLLVPAALWYGIVRWWTRDLLP